MIDDPTAPLASRTRRRGSGVSPIHRRLPARRGAARATSWWGKAWVRAVEESAYADEDLRAARSLARSGMLGPISVDRGGFGCTILDEDRLPAVIGSLALLDDAALDTFVELVAAESGRIASLLAGDLPYSLVEHAEESGVELLPYAGDFVWGCTCDAWLDPCRHALAVGYQLAWLVDADPLVLIGLRGLPRDDLLVRLHARGQQDGSDTEPDDLELGLDAALRAARALDLLEADEPIDHLL